MNRSNFIVPTTPKTHNHLDNGKLNVENSNYMEKNAKFIISNLKPNSMTLHPDQKYIEALRENDNVLIEDIYEKYYVDVEKLVLNNSGTKDQAKNLFQEALITLWESVKTTDVKLTKPFGAYFYPFYRFKWLNYLSRDKERNNIDSSGDIQDLEKYINEVIDYFNEDMENIKERRLQVFYECFKKLGEDCQKMLNLKFEGKKADEIKKMMGKPSSNSVYVAMNGCRKQLKKLIEAHPDFSTLQMQVK